MEKKYMKLIILRGLPAAGKSTIAQGIILANKNTVRISKGMLRKMLHFGKVTDENNSITDAIAYEMARLLLGKGISVVVDDPNLDPKIMDAWKKFATDLRIETEVIDMTDVPIEDCIERDKRREDSLGAVLIKNLAIRHGIKKFEPGNVLICDIDGTIADISHRLPFIIKGKKAKKDWKKDWDSFFSAMEYDLVRPEIQKLLVQEHALGKTIIFMTARPDKYRDLTMRWLQTNFLTFSYTLIMRKTNDKRPDTEVKKELLERYFPDKGVIHAILEDRPSVIKVFKDMGLNVIDAGNGKEFNVTEDFVNITIQ